MLYIYILQLSLSKFKMVGNNQIKMGYKNSTKKDETLLISFYN